MALTLTELQAITDYYVDSTDNDIYFKSNVLLFKLLGMGKTIPGGQKVKAILEYGKSNSGSYGASTKLPLSKKSIYNAAFFPWAAYYGQATVDLDDERENSGDLAVVNMTEGKLKNAQKSIRQDMGSQIYLARSANVDVDGNETGFAGLADIFNTTKSTAYGEVTENDMDKWAAKAITTERPISYTVMQAINRKATIDDNAEGEPNLFITTDVIKDGYASTLQVQARYADVKLADSGFKNILFEGVPIVKDNKQADGTLDAINTRYLDILTHKDYNFTKPTWSSPIDQPDTKVAFVRWSGQLVCKHRSAHCRHTNLTAPA